MKKFLTVILATLMVLLQACAFTQQQVVPLAQKAVRQYCAVPEAERMLLRQQVNVALAPDSIVVTCAPQTPL